MFGIRKRRPPPFGGVHVDDDKDIQEHKPEDASRNDLWSEARLLLRDLIFALMIAALVVVFVVQPVKVEGTSMLPRLHDGERIFVNKLIYYEEYRWAPKLDRGDIVVFWFPDDPSKSYIKRVIGLPNETLEIRGATVLINGQPLPEYRVPAEAEQGQNNKAPLRVQAAPPRNNNEPYTVYYTPETLAAPVDKPEAADDMFIYGIGKPLTIPANNYFVMGDNRDASSDSRRWGLVPEKYIYGKALFRYWPLGSASFISHESESNIPAPPVTDGDDSEDGDEAQ
jgi:signal peptidase I